MKTTNLIKFNTPLTSDFPYVMSVMFIIGIGQEWANTIIKKYSS